MLKWPVMKYNQCVKLGKLLHLYARSVVVAERIEKIQELNVLSQHNVDFVQGYYYAKPALFNQQLLSIYTKRCLMLSKNSSVFIANDHVHLNSNFLIVLRLNTMSKDGRM